MNFFFLSEYTYENWDYNNPDTQGIGGSETCQIEMARRLAARGHKVISFAPLPDETENRKDFEKYHEGVCWRFPESVRQFREKGIWVLSRCPQSIDRIPKGNGQKIWLVAQDVDYPGFLTPNRLEKVDLIFGLNPTHVNYLKRSYPSYTHKIVESSNGVKTDAFEKMEPVERNPYRLIFTPSPDRGLLQTIKIFDRAKEFEPRLELWACYGLNNIKKYDGKYWKTLEEEIMKRAEKPDFKWLERTPQKDLHKIIASSGIFPYPTTFTETSSINAMEAQALGAIPVFNPIWALSHNVAHGIAIEGEPTEPLTFCRYVHAVIRLTRYPDLQEQIRREMIPWARARFDWERIVDQYEALVGIEIKEEEVIEKSPNLSIDVLKEIQSAFQ